MKIQSPTQEMTEFFVTRTKYHISLVLKHMTTLASILPHGEELIIRGENHDESKWSEQEMIPYIWLHHYHKCKKEGNDIVYPPKVQEAIGKAVAHHVANNRHHYEFHQNPDGITEIDLIEMVCDWTAIAQEHNQDNLSAQQWANKVVGKTMILNSKQSLFLYNTIDILDSIK
jgi:hypothetical protein